MASNRLEPQHHALYERTGEKMLDLLGALRWGLEELDQTFAATPPSAKAAVACRAGCDFCCHVPMDVQAHEVLFVADHIQAHFSPTELAAVIERTAVHRGRIAAATPAERTRLMLPCALLREGQCSAYAGRPEACRSHHSSDAAVCRAYLSDANVAIEAAYIPALRARMFAVMLGLDQALADTGFDSRDYDFGSALHEALTNSLCLVLWGRRRAAFPDSCLADKI
jgi:hypothetical protein